MEQLDQQAYNLARAIRRTETGGSNDPYNQKGPSGEFGAYQFMPETYKSLAKKHLGDENAAPTVENQNKIAYSEIKALKDQGYNPAQIASIWNSGKPDAYKTGLKGTNDKGVNFDVPGYVTKVSQSYKELSGSPEQQDTSSEQPQEKNQATFPSESGDGVIKTGLKALGNTPKSAFNFAKGVISSLNPINVIKNIEESGRQFSELSKESGGTLPALAKTVKELPGAIYENLIPKGARQVVEGDFEGAQKSFTEDPFGQAAPLVLLARGGAELADKAATKSSMSEFVESPYTKRTIPKPSTKFTDVFDKTVENVSKPVTEPIKKVVEGAGDLAGGTAKSIASHLTGLDADTIQKIISDPKEFSRINRENVSRGGLAKEIMDSIKTRMEDLKETGKGYDSVRKSNQNVTIPDKFVENALSEFGLKVKRGKVTADSNSVTRNTSDITALNKFYKDWGNKKNLTPNEFLNMREDLAQLAKYDKVTGMGKSKSSETVGKSLRSKLNRDVRDTQLEELKALDESFSPEREFLGNVFKDYFNKDGTFKDNAPSRIANAGNKTELLKRLEGIMPGVTKRLEVLKAVEDIERASGVKVGTYGRILAGGIGLSTGGITGALLSQILTSPELAVPILRRAGIVGNKAAQVARLLRGLIGEPGDIQSKGLIPSMLQNKKESYDL